MYRVLYSILLAMTLLWAAPAQAADVWLYRNPSYIGSGEIASLQSALTAEGASVTTTTSSSWPTSYAGYRVVIILLPASGFNTAQVNALDDFLEDGGRLVLAGDWEDYVEVCALEILGICVDWEWEYIGFYAENDRINSLLSNLGTSLRISTTLFDPGSCNSTTSIASDTITSGVSRLQTSAGMALNGGGKTLANFGGRQVLSVAQPSGVGPRPFHDIVVAADVNFFTYDPSGPYCPGSTSTGWNYTLWRNLYKCPDLDGDGHSLEVCGGNDCDDSRYSVRPGADEYCNDRDDDCNDVVDDDYAVDADTWYMDWDGDRYGDPYRTTYACEQPSGHVADHTDCDDLNAAVHPGAVEVPYDGHDNDCVDGDLTDVDEDGYDSTAVSGGTDCDDDDEDINPAALEYCDLVDNDCDGTIDEGDSLDASTWYLDYDNDGYGDPTRTTRACTKPVGYVADATDCDDVRTAVNPGATEIPYDGLDNDCVGGDVTDVDGDGYDSVAVSGGSDCDDTDEDINPAALEYCDLVDNDCDGTIDEGDSLDASTWYLDYDHDGYGDPTHTTRACTRPVGYVADATDCDDVRTAVNPGATEIPYDGLDNDCVGGDVTDVDGDGFDSTAVSGGTDCDDIDEDVNPSAVEVCDRVDNDCDGDVDEPDAIDASTWYRDYDADKYGDPTNDTTACTRPTGYVSNDEDCDDTEATVYPGATEIPYDGLDNDCVGGDITDVDEDGFDSVAVAGGTDCDDTDDDINPAAVEVCDRVDNDCDDLVDESDAYDASTWYYDYDHDGFGDATHDVRACDRPTDYVSNDEDCDDTRASVYPGAVEVPYDGLDNDCRDGDLVDIDRDGRDGYLAGGTDCDDTDASVYPGAVETPDGVDEDCDTIVDEGTIWYDDDGDGWAESGGDCDDGDGGVHPGATELPDGVDQDCDETVDEGTIWYDDDGDGSTEVEGDCNDGDADVGPDLAEVPDNGIDDDCDGVIDDGVFDVDGDGYTLDAGDCDDEDASSYPGADELPDDVDNDCDETVDEGTIWYDDDGDEWSEVEGDCDDGDSEIHPEADEVANGMDDDCDGDLDEGTERVDDDGDGLSEEGGDCDDDDPTVYPGAPEVDNDVDDDCDDEVDEDFADLDRDGWAEADGDCDDIDGWVHPEAFEFCDDVDNDCDDVVDEGCDRFDTGVDPYDDVDDGSGCRFGVRVPVQAAVFLPLIALFGRRRRAL